MSPENNTFEFPQASQETAPKSLESLITEEKALNEKLMLGNYPDKGQYFDCMRQISELTENEGNRDHEDPPITSEKLIVLKKTLAKIEGTEYAKDLAKLETIKALREVAQKEEIAKKKELPQAA